MYLEGLEKAGGGRSVARNEAEGGIGKCLSWVGPEKVQEGPWTWEPETPDPHPVWQLQWPLLPYSDIPTVTRGCSTVSSDTQPYTDRHNQEQRPGLPAPCSLDSETLPASSVSAPGALDFFLFFPVPQFSHLKNRGTWIPCPFFHFHSGLGIPHLSDTYTQLCALT